LGKVQIKLIQIAWACWGKYEELIWNPVSHENFYIHSKVAEAEASNYTGKGMLPKTEEGFLSTSLHQ